jgi:aryl-alcohol dehydrogenase-like predicted oxidoreductase
MNSKGFKMIDQIPLGTQGFTTSEQGLGMMSVGITMGKQDLYGKKNDVSKKGVAELISRSIKAGVTHFDTAQIYTNLSGMMLGSWFPYGQFGGEENETRALATQRKMAGRYQGDEIWKEKSRQEHVLPFSQSDGH